VLLGFNVLWFYFFLLETTFFNSLFSWWMWEQSWNFEEFRSKKVSIWNTQAHTHTFSSFLLSPFVVFFSSLSLTFSLSLTYSLSIFDYRAFHRFGQAKLCFGALVLGSSRFLLRSQQPKKWRLLQKWLKMTWIKNDLKNNQLAL